MTRRRIGIITAVLVLVIGYSTPWALNGGAALNLGGYDLAEWASLHPAAGGEQPALLTALLLRLPLLAIGLWAAWLLPLPARPRLTRGRVAAALVVALFAIALLPPFEFVNERGNPNYQQQFGLAMIMLIGGLIGISGIGGRWRSLVAAAIALTGAGAGWIGAGRVLAWLADFQLAAVPGNGLFIVTGVFLLCAIASAAAFFSAKGKRQPEN